jgi:hypothetical protein
MLELPPSATLDLISNSRLSSLSAPRCSQPWAHFPTQGRVNNPRSADGTNCDWPLVYDRGADLIPVTVQRCRGLLTLFSKGFSSFVCTTCLLSVSVQYLAFAGVHLRICAAISNCTTLRDHKRVGPRRVEHTGRSPSLVNLS